MGRANSLLQAGAAAIGGAIVLGIITSQTVLSKGTEEQIDGSAPVHPVVRSVGSEESGGLS